MIDLLHNGILLVFYLLSLIGIAVVLWGVTEATARFLRLKFHPEQVHHHTIAETARIRERLGAHLLLGLDIFIAADVIKSVAAPNWENIGMLGAIVVIRIVMSYFLEKEIEKAHTAAQYGRRADDKPLTPEQKAAREADRQGDL